MAAIGRYIIKRGVALLLLLAAVSVISFLLVQQSPVDPIRAYIGAELIRISPEQLADIEAYWGLHDPPFERFMKWANALIHGNLGMSSIYRAPVAELIGDRFMNSLILMGTAWLISGVVGFFIGAVAARLQKSAFDRFIQWTCYTLASTPAFWLGLLLMIVFAVWLKWFPVGLSMPAGVPDAEVTLFDRLRHIVLPALTLSIVGMPAVALHTREKFVDFLNGDVVLYARSRGIDGWRLFRRHGFRHAVLPALTLQFASFSELFGGTVLAEQVFSYPGLGQATVEASMRGDIPLLLGIVLFSTVFVFIGNTLADISYRIVDPRMRRRIVP